MKGKPATALETASPPVQGRRTVAALFDFIPQGNGTFLAVPRKPVDRASITEAAKLSGLKRDTIYRLYISGFIQGSQPSPGKIIVDVVSLLEHIGKASEPDFWTPEQRMRLDAGVLD